MKSVYNSLAFIFPGQGSQSVGMLKELAADHTEVEQTFASASEVLGYDLWRLVSGGPADQLNLTEFTQPAMLAAGVSCWRVWNKLCDIGPGWMAGHSLGEYTALVCAGSMSFEDGVVLVAKRARLMQQAVPPDTGAMAAILGLDDSAVVSLCSAFSSPEATVAPANFNAPGQVVIAGHAAAVARAVEAAKAEGAKRAVLLPVSVPSHCPLMSAAAEEFAEVLTQAKIGTPTVPVVHNVDVATHAAPERIRAVLKQQLYSSVRWADCARFMYEQGVRRFVECGPGKVLSSLNKRIVPEAKVEALFDPDSLQKALEFAR